MKLNYLSDIKRKMNVRIFFINKQLHVTCLLINMFVTIEIICGFKVTAFHKNNILYHLSYS